MKYTAIVIAFAAIGFASTAQAQSKLEVYGIIDNYVELYDNGANTTGRLSSGGMAGSRLGLRGSEGLGGGLEAFFSLEAGLLTDSGLSTGGNNGAGYLFQREALVGLRGGFGAVSLGRQYTPHFMTLAMNDPAGLAMSSSINYFSAPAHNGVNGGPGKDGVTRRDNSVAYTTPKVAGLQATLYGAMGEATDIEGQPSNSVGNTYSVGLRYVAGALTANASYLQQQPLYRNVAGDEGKDTFVAVSAAYDLGLIKPSFTYAMKDSHDTAAAPSLTSWQVGVAAPMLGGTLIGTFAMLKNDSLDAADANAWGVRYDYPMSKRTTLYGGVTGIRNESRANYGIGGGGGSSLPILGALGDDPTSIYTGIAHTF